MDINQAIQYIGTKTPLMLESALLALESNNNKIEFVNSILEQYYETEGNKSTLTRLYGECVLNVLISWSKAENQRQEQFVMNKSLI